MRLIDPEPVLDEELIALGKWISGYYCAPLGEVLRSMLPLASDISVYDAEGTSHQLSMSFTSAGADSNNWTLSVTDDEGNTIGTANLVFGANGTLSSITQGGTTESTAGSM